MVHPAERTRCLKTEARKASGILSGELQVGQHGFLYTATENQRMRQGKM